MRLLSACPRHLPLAEIPHTARKVDDKLVEVSSFFVVNSQLTVTMLSTKTLEKYDKKLDKFFVFTEMRDSIELMFTNFLGNNILINRNSISTTFSINRCMMNLVEKIAQRIENNTVCCERVCASYCGWILEASFRAVTGTGVHVHVPELHSFPSAFLSIRSHDLRQRGYVTVSWIDKDHILLSTLNNTNLMGCCNGQ